MSSTKPNKPTKEESKDPNSLLRDVQAKLIATDSAENFYTEF